MNRIIVLGIALLFITQRIEAQILPKEGSKLNYRLIGFSFPDVQKATSYDLEVAAGNYNSEDSFNRHIVKKVTVTTNKVITEVPFFGCQYTWRVVNSSTAARATSGMYHFSTLTVPEADTSLTRLRILHRADKYKDAYVFLDGNKAMYDMDGRPFWFLTDSEKNHVRDLKLSTSGTLTFLDAERIFEIDYNGKIKWSGPNTGAVSGDKSEYYHHELTRMANGHYMVMGKELTDVTAKMPPRRFESLSGPHPEIKSEDSNKLVNLNLPFTTLIEYDERGNVVWKWKSSGYFIGPDQHYRKMAMTMPSVDAHANSFYFDEKAKSIYVSFKNINTILKIKYPEGVVTNSYGAINKPGEPTQGINLFSGQHSAKISKKDYLMVYNNNDSIGLSIPSVTVFKELPENNSLKKVWEYKCVAEPIKSKEKVEKIINKFYATTGGNVIELPDESIFVSMNDVYDKLFIVNQEKKILWSAMPERWDKEENKWVANPQYRASIVVDRGELERLIWNQEQ